MTTQDPNHPIDSGNEVAPWSGEPANTPGSQDTELVAGHGNPTNQEAKLVDSSYTDAKTVDTEGIYQSPGYSLGAQEDDTTNPSTIHPNTNSGQGGVPYANYDGTTNGGTAASSVVPGDTEFAYGHGYNAATDNNKSIPPTQPGAKQPDIQSGTFYVGDADAGAHGNQGFLDTNPWATGFPGDGTGGLSGGEVSLGTGLYATFYGQANSAPQVLDTTNTSNPTALAANNGTALGNLTALDLTNGTGHVFDSSNIDGAYPGLTMGQGVTAPGKPTAVSWTFGANSAEVSWTAPLLSAPVQAAAVVTTLDAGTFGATGTYFYVITATDLLGETTVSNEQSAVVAATTSSVTVSWGAVTNATGYKVYRGTATGAENKLIATITSGSTLSFKDRGAAGTTATLPATNTAGQGGGGHIREYVVYGWRVRAGKLPANDAAADAYLTNGILPTVTAHSRGVTEYKADGTTVVKVPATRVRVDHLEPGEYYFFRVAARNEVSTGLLSAITGVTYPTAPAFPSYFLSSQKIDGTQVLIPGSTDPEGESLAEATFAGNTGVDDDNAALTGQTANQLAGPGEAQEDRI